MISRLNILKAKYTQNGLSGVGKFSMKSIKSYLMVNVPFVRV